MRALKLAERQENLKNAIDMMKPLKLNFHNLPTITQKEEMDNHLKIKSWQQSPKVFINTEQAMIWIKKDIDKKNRHDLFQMIKKKAEQQLILQKASQLKNKELRGKRNLSYTLRKYSSTSRSPNSKKINKAEISCFNMTQNLQQKKQRAHFLRIKILEAAPSPSKINIKSRVRTQKSKNQTISFSGMQGLQKNQKCTGRAGSQGKFMKRVLPRSEDSFSQQFLTPW